LKETIYLGKIKSITPELFREAANYLQNKTLTLESANNFAYIKENNKLIFAEIELAVKN
jgi:hypothetical protein